MRTRRRLAPLLLVVACACTAVDPEGSAPADATGSDETESAPLTFTADPDRGVRQIVTFVDGGSVSTTAADGTTFTLDVPPFAVAEDVEISMTPLLDVRGFPEEPQAVHAVQLGPEGLAFYEFATLTIVPSDPIPTDEQLMFEARGDGSEAIAELVDPAAEDIVLLVDHFTAEGVAQVTPQQRAAFMRESAEDAERRINGEIGAATQAERDRQLGQGDDSQNAATTEEIDRLLDEAKREVVDRRLAAAAIDCQHMYDAVRTAIGHERAKQLLGSGTEESYAALMEALPGFNRRVAECEEEARRRCKAEKQAGILVAFWLQTYPTLFGSTATPAGVPQPSPEMLEAARRICEPQGFRLEFSGEGFPLRTAQVGTSSTFDVDGFLQACPDDDGILTFEGETALDYSSGIPSTTETLLDLEGRLRGVQEPPASFVIVLSPVESADDPYWQLAPADFDPSYITFTDVAAEPGAVLSFYNNLGEHVGDFGLDVQPVDPMCEESPDEAGPGTDATSGFAAAIEGGPHAGSYTGIATDGSVTCEAGSAGNLAFTYTNADAGSDEPALVVIAIDDPEAPQDFSVSVIFGDGSDEGDLLSIEPAQASGSGTASVRQDDAGVSIEIDGETADGIGLGLQMNC